MFVCACCCFADLELNHYLPFAALKTHTQHNTNNNNNNNKNTHTRSLTPQKGARWLGCAVGMAVGCLLGLTPLLFMDIPPSHPHPHPPKQQQPQQPAAAAAAGAAGE